jgi:acetyl esterase/lipase
VSEQRGDAGAAGTTPAGSVAGGVAGAEPVRVVADADLGLDGRTLAEVARAGATASPGGAAEVVHAGGADACAAALEQAVKGGELVVLVAGPAAGPDLAEAAAACSPRVVWVDLAPAVNRRPAWLDPARLCVVRGRGLGGISWAVRAVRARAASPPRHEPYGEDPEQYGELRLPEPGTGPVPVCVLLHGGHWREQWERDLMDPLAVDLTRRGYATWNLEYRRVGPSGGGWPGSFVDVAAGIDHLGELADRVDLDLGRVIAVGHSAGAQLGMWGATRRRLGDGQPGARPLVEPALVLALAAVPDLAHSARLGIDHRAAAGMLGGTPAEVPERYAHASPAERLPLACPCLLVYGERDSPDLLEENRLFIEACRRAGQDLEVLELAGEDHFSLIDPGGAGWGIAADRLSALGGGLGRSAQPMAEPNSRPIP